MKCRVFSPVKKGLWTKPEQFSSFSPSPGQLDILEGEMKPIKLLLLLLLFFSGKIQGSIGIIQKLLPTGKESNISLTEDVCPENASVFWCDYLNGIIGIYYSDGKTIVMPLFERKVNITGPRTLTFLSPQTSDSRVYFAKVIGDQHNNTTIPFNVIFQDQNMATTVSSSTVSPTVSSAAIAVLVIIAVAAAAIWRWRHQKKKSQDQKEVVLFSANSETNSPNVQILLPPPQENGALHLPESDHLMEENTGDSAV